MSGLHLMDRARTKGVPTLLSTLRPQVIGGVDVDPLKHRFHCIGRRRLGGALSKIDRVSIAAPGRGRPPMEAILFWVHLFTATGISNRSQAAPGVV